MISLYLKYRESRYTQINFIDFVKNHTYTMTSFTIDRNFSEIDKSHVKRFRCKTIEDGGYFTSI